MKKLFNALVLAMILVPAISFAQQQGPTTLNYGGLVKCDGVTTASEQDRQKVCDFQALMGMVNSVIQWVFMLTIPIFVIMIAYAGFLYMTPNPGNREKSNKMLWAGLKGFVIMLIAWFAVTTLVGWIVNPEFMKTAGSLLDK